MRTLLTVFVVSIFLSACGEKFRGDFVGTAYPGITDCGLEPGDIAYDIRVAGSVSSSRASLRVIELKPQGSQGYSTGTAYKFGQFFRGFEIKADVINKESIISEGKDTIYRVSDRSTLELENIDDEGRYVQEVTDEFDIVTTSGAINRARDEITNLEIERKTRIRDGASGQALDCTFSLYVPELVLEK